MQCFFLPIFFLIFPTIFGGGGDDQIRRKTSASSQNNGISKLSDRIRIRSQISRWATNAINNKKDESIKNPQECAKVLNEVLRNKPKQLFNLMWGKGVILKTFLEKLDPDDDEREIYEEFYKIYKEMLKELQSIGLNELTLNNFVEIEKSEDGLKIVKFGQFQISEWPRKIFMFHGKEKGDQKLRGIFEKFKRDGGRTKLATEWWAPDAMIENIQETLLKADKFLRAFTGQPGSYMRDLKAIELGLKGTNDIRLGRMVYNEVWDKLNEDISELKRVKVYLADERNVNVRYQVRKDGRLFSEIVRHKTEGANSSKRKSGENLSVDQVIINEEIHDATFFEDLFAPYLVEFFEILTKDEHNGGFVFNFIHTKNDHTKVLAVDVGQVILNQEMPKIEPLGFQQSNTLKGEKKWLELVEIDQNPELNDKAKNPLQLEGQLLAHLLASLYAKLVGRFEHLTYRWNQPLVSDTDLTLIFHAYNYALASELFKRMKELDERYDVFYETETTFKDSPPMTPQRDKSEEKNWLNDFLEGQNSHKSDKDDVPLTPEQETSNERERFERFEIIQKLYKKVEEKKWKIMEKLVDNYKDLLRHMGYGQLLKENEGKNRVKALAETLETEMSMTLDNLELNWAVDCHVDDIEKCLFAENNDLDFNMPEMRLFHNEMDQMSKVQKFLEWMYQKLNRRIAKMTKKFNKEGNPVKSFLIAKCIEVLDEFRQLFENRITLAEIFIPFWKEFKDFVAWKAVKYVANSKLMRMFLGIRDNFRVAQNVAKIFWKYFEFDQSKLSEKLIAIENNLATKADDDPKADKKIAKSTISSIFKPMMRSVLKKVGIFQHFKNYFRIDRLPELRLLFGKLKRKFAKKKVEAPPLSTPITSTTGVRKQWHTKWGHKILSTLVINAAYRSINIVVVQNGSAIRFAASTGFFLLTIVYMTAVLWVCRHLLWQITCSTQLVHCGHYISVAFAIIAAGIWMGLMIAIF